MKYYDLTNKELLNAYERTKFGAEVRNTDFVSIRNVLDEADGVV